MSDEGVPLPTGNPATESPATENPATENPDTAHADQAREQGWNEPEQYDYEMFKGEVRATEGDEKAAPLPEWESNAIKYEWKEEYGDVGPENTELEKMLFFDEHHMRKGENFMV